MKRLSLSLLLVAGVALAACGHRPVEVAEPHGTSVNVACPGAVTVKTPYAAEPFAPGGTNFGIWSDAPGVYTVFCDGAIVLEWSE